MFPFIGVYLVFHFFVIVWLEEGPDAKFFLFNHFNSTDNHKLIKWFC